MRGDDHDEPHKDQVAISEESQKNERHSRMMHAK
jgi:hypothetical protein